MDLEEFSWLDVHCWLRHCSSWEHSSETIFELSSLQPVSVATNGVFVGAAGADLYWNSGPILKDFLSHSESVPLDRPSAVVTALAVAPSGLAVVGYNDGSVWLWSQQRAPRLFYTTNKENAPITAAVITDDEFETEGTGFKRTQRAAVADSTGEIFVFDLTATPVNGLYSPSRRLVPASDEVTALGFGSNETILVGYRNGQLLKSISQNTLRLYGPREDILDWIRQHSSTITPLALSNVPIATTPSVAPTIHLESDSSPLWSILPPTIASAPPARNTGGAITAVSNGPNESLIVGYQEGEIVHWSEAGVIQATYFGHEGSVLALSNAHSSGSFSSVGRGNVLRSWGLEVSPPSFIWVASVLIALLVVVFALLVYRDCMFYLRSRRNSHINAEPDIPLSEGGSATATLRARVDKIVSFLTNPDSQGPFAIAIIGEWGSGKSSLMQLVDHDLKIRGYPSVWFNAWHHQSEKEMFAALMQSIRMFGPFGPASRFSASQWVLQATNAISFWFHLIVLRAKRRPVKVLWFVLLLGFVILAGVLAPSTVAKYIQAVEIREIEIVVRAMSALFAGAIALSKLNPFRLFTISPRSLRRNGSSWWKLPKFSSELGFRYRYEREFGDVCDAFGDRHLVILIDDLDRCKPEQCIEILEALSFLKSSGKFFVLLGISEEQVQQAVSFVFRDIAVDMERARDATQARGRKGGPLDARREFRARQAYARNYLEKIIDIYIDVPPLTTREWKEARGEITRTSDS